MARDRFDEVFRRLPEESVRSRFATAFGLNRNIIAVSMVMFLMGLGENLWRRFVPKYLESLGAPISAIGLFGTTENFLDGVFQYPGGWIADRYGRRLALLWFVTLTIVGYAIFATMHSWQLGFLALTFVMAWDAMASPTLFAVVGDALPSDKRTMGFTVQSILRRVPIIIAPTIGGLAITSLGLRDGMRLGLAVSIGLAVFALVVSRRVQVPVIADVSPVDIRHVWQTFGKPLRWLLVSDVFIRACDALVSVFLVLFALNIVGVSPEQFGILVAVQAAAAMAVYLPAARVVTAVGKKPFVTATFVAFSAFPLAVVASHSFAALLVAFVIGGLREIGEPARKALIVDLAVPALRARTVGLYYLGRSLAIAPAAFVGGFLWNISPAIPFYVATAIGAVGTLVFVRTVDAAHAG